MTVLELRFPAGRFHATPWGRHVNEGAVEWPPSPWRLLRSLIATWYLKARTEVTAEIIRSLLHALSTQAPSFYLPKATNGHTRHYMPIIEGKNEKTTKIFDTFIQLNPENTVLIAWDLDLPPEQFTALRILAERLGYLGRAESLVEATVREEMTSIQPNAVPLLESEKVPSDQELIRLLLPMPSAAYADWRTDFLAKYEATPEKPGKTPKKTSTKKTKNVAVPPDLFQALEADTGEIQSAGWNLPPGSMWVNYLRPSDAFAPALRTSKTSGKTKPTVARYAVVSSVSPRLIDAVSVANRVHQSLCSYLKEKSESASVFSGLDSEGNHLIGHRHAHIFCEANGSRDAITHLTVWADMGFGDEACLALRRLNRVWGHGDHDLRLVLVGIGTSETFPDNQIFGASKVWRSLTPFVPTRHAKTFRDGRPKIDEATGWQIGSAGHDLLRLLSLKPETAGAKIRQDKAINIGQAPNTRSLRCLQFQTTRPAGGGSRGQGEGGSFTISFPKPVAGPLTFGYGSHFGLGLFVPEKSKGNSMM